MSIGQLISVHPEELTFEVELEKPAYCNLMLVNNTEHHVAFKVKTTSPKKYFVRPNSCVVQPWDSCTINVTLQAQEEYPIDMQCADKFLLQSTKVLPSIDFDEIPPDTFTNDGKKVIEECKLRVAYVSPQSGHSNSDGVSKISTSTDIHAVQRLRQERDTTLHQNKQLQRELEILRSKNGRSKTGFSVTFAVFAGFVGLLVGIILSIALSSSSL